MAHEHPRQALFEAAVDAESRHGVRHVNRQALFGAQALQGADHGRGAGKLRTGFVSPELTLAREPHDDGAGQEAQDQFGEDGRDVVGNAAALIVLEHHLVDKVADDPCEEHHEGVHHALHQCQGDHVTVGNVADLVGQYRFDFIGRKTLEQTLADRDQGIIFVPACGKGIRLIGRENPHFRHFDSRLAGQLLNGLHQPLFMTSTRLSDHLGAGAHLRHPFGDEQREQRPCKTKDRTEHQQLTEVQINPVGRHEPVKAEQAQGDAGNQHDRQVSGQKQQNAHHGCKNLLVLKVLPYAGI